MFALRLLPRLAVRARQAPRRSFTTSRLLLSEKITYEKMVALPPATRIVDVREPAEFEAGAIPRAVNIPLMSSPEAFILSEEEFEDRFGFEKPPKDQDVVFYCKAGVRSAAAAEIAEGQGYTKVMEYPGSWNEWEKKQKEGSQ